MRERSHVQQSLTTRVPQHISLYTPSQSPPTQTYSCLHLLGLPYDLLEMVIKHPNRVSLYMLRQSSPFFFRSCSTTTSGLASFPHVTHGNLNLVERLRVKLLLRGECACATVPRQDCQSSECRDWLMGGDDRDARYALWSIIFSDAPLGSAGSH